MASEKITQSQQSLCDQLEKLYVLANKAGLYDAADFIKAKLHDIRDFILVEEIKAFDEK